jgi:hypothetical protein
MNANLARGLLRVGADFVAGFVEVLALLLQKRSTDDREMFQRERNYLPHNTRHSATRTDSIEGRSALLRKTRTNNNMKLPRLEWQRI